MRLIDANEALEEAVMKCGNAFRKAAKALEGFANGALKTITEIAEAENALAAVSDYDVVFALHPVAKELSELTGKRYIDILDQARGMILEGNEIPDVLRHFDIMLDDLKNGKK